MSRRPPANIPGDLRSRLEQTRLDSLALFRALDRIQPGLTPPEIPQRLIHHLFELDADCAEALWALDQPPGKLDSVAMVRDTLIALDQIPEERDRLRQRLPAHARAPIVTLEATIRSGLDPAEAYNDVPGRDPSIR
jgi:hypothetical protein